MYCGGVQAGALGAARPSWLPRLNGGAAHFFADFTTEGGSSHYWAGGAQRAGSAAWLSALTGSSARNSLGAYNTVGGLVAFAAANALRFDFDLTSHAANGIPYEPAATNVLLQSKDFTQAAWAKVFANGASAPVVTANAGTSPDGTATAQRLQAARTGAAGSYSLLTQTANVAAGNPVSDGFWLKSNTGTNQNVLCYDPANAYGTVFVATPIWQRVALPPHTAGAQVAVAIGTAAGSGQYFQGGDATFDVLIWNAQITLEAAPSSDIVTGAASATRLADALSITIPGGVSQIVVIFDDNSTQTVAGLSAGAYTVPTNLNRARIKSMAGYP